MLDRESEPTVFLQTRVGFIGLFFWRLSNVGTWGGLTWGGLPLGLTTMYPFWLLYIAIALADDRMNDWKHA